jgi:acetyl-CoA carboxylase biotin carboxyl carrier protein
VTDLVSRDQLGLTDPDPAARPAALLAEVNGSVLRLLAELPRLPGRIRISARDIVVELEWPAADQPASPPATVAPARVAAAAAVTDEPAPDGHHVTAATVGTFHRAPEPGAAPFVDAGDPVLAGQQIGIVEAMKLMIPVEADVDGLVREVLKEDGQPVEFGDPLFLIERS